jgi:hypothetical protein
MTGYETTVGHCGEFEPNTVRVLRILSSSVKNFRCCIAHPHFLHFSRPSPDKVRASCNSPLSRGVELRLIHFRIDQWLHARMLNPEAVRPLRQSRAG